ncbi:hypothetical protein PSECIP111854_02190 [Pseudoalteromonas sp. CIP111854]|uniref:DUF4488 domain-containing protein n=1 Tax=Pseudoalteromonas holothuriae TaxID=2963714 RepID=A0A9W4QY17_9GAMM|nr:hypothetical protein [Pseudoalteromonas sp. CIP111854]CAH9058379.1 hypothetical protein PSECIP111854_02190 [Pseudoalteromonas sp. CIP111854]
MKKESILLVILLYCTQSEANPLLGTWQFVEGKYATQSGYVSAKAPSLSSVKVISPTHFSYITQKDGAFLYAGGGPYKLDDKYFYETFAYGNVPSLQGKTMAFNYKIEGQLWHHTLHENGKLVEAEIWERVSN